MTEQTKTSEIIEHSVIIVRISGRVIYDHFRDDDDQAKLIGKVFVGAKNSQIVKDRRIRDVYATITQAYSSNEFHVSCGLPHSLKLEPDDIRNLKANILDALRPILSDKIEDEPKISVWQPAEFGKIPI
jgi:hypothetical protein